MTVTPTSILTYVLRHPVAMRLKRAWRDVRWRLRGEVAVNPPLPARIDSILFVCLGNICRSPFAGMLAQRLLADTRGVAVIARSAGIRTTQSGTSPGAAREAARAYGVSLDMHRPTMLTAESMAAHDLIVVMEYEQMRRLQHDYPDQASRVVLLSLFEPGVTGYERFNIEDPFMRSAAEFAYCYQRIASGVTALCGQIAHRGTDAGRRIPPQPVPDVRT